MSLGSRSAVNWMRQNEAEILLARALPMSVLPLGPLRLPFSGGGYLRLLPERMIRYGFERFARRGVPVVVYLHPRDFAPDCPRVPMSPVRGLKCYVGLHTTAGKLEMLLGRYQFDTCSAILRARLRNLIPAD